MKEATDVFRWTDCGCKLVGPPPKYLSVFHFAVKSILAAVSDVRVVFLCPGETLNCRCMSGLFNILYT